MGAGDKSETDQIFRLMESIFEVLTWGYIGEVIFSLILFTIIMGFLFLLRDYKIMNYLFKDRVYFMKNYIYQFIKEKVSFIRSVLFLIKQEWRNNWKGILIIFLAFILFVGVVIFAFKLGKPETTNI